MTRSTYRTSGSFHLVRYVVVEQGRRRVVDSNFRRRRAACVTSFMESRDTIEALSPNYASRHASRSTR